MAEPFLSHGSSHASEKRMLFLAARTRQEPRSRLFEGCSGVVTIGGGTRFTKQLRQLQFFTETADHVLELSSPDELSVAFNCIKPFGTDCTKMF